MSSAMIVLAYLSVGPRALSADCFLKIHLSGHIFTSCIELLSIYRLTLFLFIADMVASFCCNLRCCGTSFLTSNVSCSKDEIRLSMSHFIVVEACEKSWYSLQSLLIFSYSISICCKKGSVESMS